MDSRRTTSRSSFGNGRSNSGDDMSGSSRSSSCSYLSNVRPENRSTLCSMMAQLTEETQPSFETTLKSRAVSENCNVKFTCVVTGYPIPQVMWYKDDVQLDRYCGLPKYEIFRNGQNHSLHIYNCTVEDAAIYQTSASNSKGIVSCSGVLEVGEMNEFKIHQRYFAKLKQKAESRRSEAEGKENQEPLRTISPDRTQRKRRSTMEAFLSTPSSTGDGGAEDSLQAAPVETVARLQEATVEQAEEKPVGVANGAVSAVTNGQVCETGNKSGTFTYDSSQKVFIAHQPKTPFVKKKIKMSNSPPGELPSEGRRAKDETLTSLSLACTEPVPSEGNSEEFMDVDNMVTSSAEDSRKVSERHQKSETERKHSKGKNVRVEVAVLSQEGPLPTSVPAAAFTSHTVSGTKTGGVLSGERPLKEGHTFVGVAVPLEKVQLPNSVPAAAFTSPTVSGSEGNETEQHFEMQQQSPHLTSSHPQSSAATAPPRSTVKGYVSKTARVEVMDVDEKLHAPTGESLARGDIVSVNTPRESTTSSLPREQAGHRLPAKETSPAQRNVPVSRPAPLNEAHTKMKRNDAPVGLGLPPNQMGAQPPQKTRSEGEAVADDTQTPLSHCGLQAAIDKITQDTWDHSRGSNESHRALFTDIQKSSLQSPGGGENFQGCNVSPCAQQSQFNTAIKTVEGTELQVDEKVEGKKVGKVFLESDSVAPNEKIVEMETKSTVLHMIEHKEAEKTKDATDKEGESNKETEKNEHMLEMKEETISTTKDLHSSMLEPAIPLQKKPSEHTKNKLRIKEIQVKPNDIHVAVLLASQIKALDSVLLNSVTALPVHACFVQDPTTTVTEAREELKEDHSKPTEKKLMSDRETDTSVTPPRNTKGTLIDVYNQLNKTDHQQSQSQCATSQHVQALQNPSVIPPISVIDTGSTTETAGLHGSDRTYHDGVMDISQETGASTQVPLKDSPLFSLSQSENVKQIHTPLNSKDALTKRLSSGTVSREPGTPLALTPLKHRDQESSNAVSERAKCESVHGKDIQASLKLTTETTLNYQTPKGINDINSTTLDQGEMEERDSNSSPLQMLAAESVHGTDTQENTQRESSRVEEFSRADVSGNPTSGASPLSKTRDSASPIPSATPQELASGARRKIIVPKAKTDEALEVTLQVDNPTQTKEDPSESSKPSANPVPLATSPRPSRRSPLLRPPVEQTSPAARRSPLLSRRKMASESQAPSQPPTEDIHVPKTQGKPAEKEKHDPFKAPQVIRKVRGETFADASGHLKLWCQFFNVLSDSTIKWYRNTEPIAQINVNAGDETQVNLAIVQATCKDSGVYSCTITNEYGTKSTDCLLSADILAGMFLREDLGVGEEIEMTPMIFNKGVADSGVWGNTFFGRIMMQESHIGDGCARKVWRAKVIYGLEPVFESGKPCIIKACNPIAYGGKAESSLIDRNLDIVKQECKIQNLAREYCKIFSAEARTIPNFGPGIEVIPVYLMYRPANPVPYATVEADLSGVFQKYSTLDHSGAIDMRSGSEAEKKCCALQHWIFQWTNGSLLLTRLEGVDTKITNVGISVKSTGHQGLSVEGNPKVFEQFVSQHRCNYFCGLLSLRSLKVMDCLPTPSKPKGSRSPLLQRKMAGGSSSPQAGRRAAGSPRLPRKTEQEGRNTPTEEKAAPKLVVLNG
ncbi:alpha-protein kinase 3-like isoform X2 [Pungitius pungitius]|uniref:alpha-protein kinase 3-like isoform X2 n=1 Tax=Pungitius pungitius TaxID=134920 RepID=UPI002E153920